MEKEKKRKEKIVAKLFRTCSTMKNFIDTSQNPMIRDYYVYVG